MNMTKQKYYKKNFDCYFDRPRLGPMLHRIVGMGVLYFVLASIEGCMRALKASLPAFYSGAESHSQLSELG